MLLCWKSDKVQSVSCVRTVMENKLNWERFQMSDPLKLLFNRDLVKNTALSLTVTHFSFDSSS